MVERWAKQVFPLVLAGVIGVVFAGFTDVPLWMSLPVMGAFLLAWWWLGRRPSQEGAALHRTLSDIQHTGNLLLEKQQGVVAFAPDQYRKRRNEIIAWTESAYSLLSEVDPGEGERFGRPTEAKSAIPEDPGALPADTLATQPFTSFIETKLAIVNEMKLRSPEFEDLSSWLPHVLVALATAGWAIWFARLAVKSWNGFWFGVFDVGIFDQGVWLLSKGIEPFITLRGLNLFGDHSSWVLILIAPLYLVWPNIDLLVILAAVIPAVAAWLSFRIGVVEGLRTWSAAAIAIAVLLHPAMAWTTWDSFHPETFAIALIPAAYLAARRAHPWWFVTLGMLVGIVKEDAFLVVIPLAIYIGWRWKEMRLHAIGLGLLVAGLAMFNFGVALPALSPTGELIYTGRYSWETGLVITWGRLEYLAAMLLPIAIVLRAPLLLAIAGPITAANLASQFPYQQEIRWHYTAYLLGVLAIAAPVGLAKLFESWGSDVGFGFASSSRRFTVPLVFPLLGIAIVGMLALGPDITFSGVWGGASPERQAEVYAAFELIPDDAVVAASHTFAPHLAHRTRIYMLPNPWVADSWGVTENVPPRPDPSEIEWMVVNLVSAGDTERRVVEEAIEDGWTEAATGDGFTVLRAPSR